MKMSGRYFYRCFSDCSAGGLVSGKGRMQTPLSRTELESEFDNHMRLHRKRPTALVSTSIRFIDTLQRALSKLHDDGETPDQIWIAFIFVPDADNLVYHHAEGLANALDDADSGRLRYEYLFEWEIPERYLIHKISLETLKQRGFDLNEYLVDGALPPTAMLREQVGQRMLDPSHGGYNIGLGLGSLARTFGARAPTHQIAFQIIRDCSYVRFTNYDAQFMRVSYGDKKIHHLDFEHFCDIEHGVDTALLDWWLADSDFLDAYETYCAWVVQIAEDIGEEQNLWRNGNISAERYMRSKQQATARVENAAIGLGL